MAKQRKRHNNSQQDKNKKLPQHRRTKLTASKENAKTASRQLRINPGNTDNKQSKVSAVVAIIAGILVIIAGWTIFNYFSGATKEGKINEEGIATVQTEEATTDTESEGIVPETTVTQSTQTEQQTWMANDYKFGDISGNSYTVVRGDTLWEISEAVYGNGTQWHKIAEANNVGYLPNGNPLITPGQVLTLPAT